MDMNRRFLGKPNLKIRDWCIKQHEKHYLGPMYFEAVDADATVKLAKSSALAPTITLESSLDGKTWNTTYDCYSETVVPKGTRLYLRAGTAGNVAFCALSGSYVQPNSFQLAGGKVRCAGDIMQLLSQSQNATLAAYAFCRLFKDCTTLVSAPKLTAMTLANWCYCHMFDGCTALTAAPELPATTFSTSFATATDCYYSMFEGCTSLTAAPRLPATNLASFCYARMFCGCTSLTAAPRLPAMALDIYCYNNMFEGCTALSAAPELPATTLANNCYSDMFSGCTALAAAPELPATTLAGRCYQYMFSGCTALSTAPQLPAKTLASWCYAHMFYDCTSLSTAPRLPATTLADNCYYCMFHNCKALVSAPELPALRAAEGCYQYMFYGCTSLSVAPGLPATTTTYCCYDHMFQGCTALTASPPVLYAKAVRNFSYYAMFSGCTSLSVAPEIQAKEATEYGLAHMFQKCTQLNLVDVSLTAWDDNSTYNWLDQAGTAAASKTFRCYPVLPIERGASRIPDGWTVDATKVDKNLIMKGVSGTDYEFDAVNQPIAGNLAYVMEAEYGKTSTLSPFSQNPELSDSANLVCVIDTKNEISSVSTGAFCNCTSLSSVCCNAATSIGARAFEYCESLVSIDIAAVLSVGASAFYGCTSLSSVGCNAVTSIGAEAFRHCESLFSIDIANALSVEARAFCNCTSLSSVGCNAVTSIGEGAFEHCESLVSIDIANALSVEASAFCNCTCLSSVACPNASSIEHSAFSDCSSLVTVNCQAASRICESAFKNCTSLSSVMLSGVYDVTQLEDDAFKNCFAPLSVHLYTDEVIAKFEADAAWNQLKAAGKIEFVPVVSQPQQNSSICFEALQDESTVGMVDYVEGQYVCSLDGENWNDYVLGTTIGLNAGEKAYFRAKSTNSAFGTEDTEGLNKIIATGKLKVSGNIQSLLDYTGQTTIAPDYCFANMFDTVHSIVDASELLLPAQTVGKYCYTGMFYGCTALTATPLELPALKLSGDCYKYMFEYCAGISAGPAISAQVMASNACAFMFSLCGSLKLAPTLNITKLARSCCFGMFSNCHSLKIREGEGPGTKILDIPEGTTSYRDWSTSMFEYTGGTFTDDPVVGAAYYCYSNLEPQHFVMKGMSGTEYIYDANDSAIAHQLRYCIESTVIEPYSQNQELSDRNNLVAVIDLDNGIDMINVDAFTNCQNLQSVACLSVLTVDYEAFANCQALTSIDCPNALSINGSTFYNCSSLKYVNLSAATQVTKVNQTVFRNCTYPITVYLSNDYMVNQFENNQVWSTLKSDGKVIFSAVT